MNSTISFVYHSPAAGEGTRWIRLQQEDDALEAVTVAEAAQAIDNVFGLTPCYDASANDSGQGSADEEEAPPRDRFASVMAALMTAELCSQPDYWTAHVLVLRSHADPAYVLRGEAETGPVTIAATERITRTQREEIDLSSASADLSWPYAGNLTTTAPATVTLTVKGSTVYASRPCGRIIVRYRTSYDRVSVRVPVEATGSQRDDGTVERPILENAVLIAFWGDQATELALSPPAQDEDEDQAQIDHYCAGRAGGGGGSSSGDCWRIRRSRYLCDCSKSEVGDPVETRISAPCPKGVKGGAYLGTEDVVAGYITCPGEEDEVNDPDYYAATCCTPPPPRHILPRCKETYAVYRGGAAIAGGAERYQRLYGANVQLTAVAPEGGICGEQITEWDTTAKNCCDDIIPLSPHPDNPTEFKAGESHWIEAQDGKPGELIWTARGGLYFWTDRKVYTLRTQARRVMVYAESEGVCPEPSIKVDDGCDPLEMSFVGGGADPLRLPDNDYVLAPDQQIRMVASGGVPPMRWQVDDQIKIVSWDQDTGRSVLLEASHDFCGSAEISVIDVCGEEATTAIRSTSGHWERVALDGDAQCAPFVSPRAATRVDRCRQYSGANRGLYEVVGGGKRALFCVEMWQGKTHKPTEGSCEEGIGETSPTPNCSSPVEMGYQADGTPFFYCGGDYGPAPGEGAGRRTIGRICCHSYSHYSGYWLGEVHHIEEAYKWVCGGGTGNG